MKKLLLIPFLLISVVVISQDIKWGERYKAKDDNSIYEYIGSIGDVSYYSFGYKTTGFSIRRFNRFGFMAVKDNNVIKYNNDYIKIPLFSSIANITTNDEVGIIYYDKDKKDDINEIKCKFLNKNSLTEKYEKTLLSYEIEKKQNQYIKFYNIKDSSGFVITYMNVHKKSRVGYFSINTFDKELNKIWSINYSPSYGGKVLILDILPVNKKELYILSLNEFGEKKDKKTILVLSKITSEGTKESIVRENVEFNSGKIYKINNEKIFIAGTNNNTFTGITYNVSSEKLLNSSEFSYKKSKEANWGINDIFLLKNGNIIAIPNDAFKVTVYNSKAANSYIYVNRNFYAICLNPSNGKIVYNQLISRATKVNSNYDTEFGQFEKVMFFTQDNDFYAIYNTHKNDDELCGEILTDGGLKFPSTSNNIITNLLKIDNTGKTSIKTLFGQKDSKTNFSENISFKDISGKIQLGRFEKDKVNFGTMIITQ